MLWSKAISFVVLTIATHSQLANAEISARTPAASSRHGDVTATTSAIADTDIGITGLSSDADVSSEFLLRNVGLRSLSSYTYGPHAADGLDSWLMLLVGGGLVVLQVRRKQKTLPQRPLIDTENKLFWG